MPEQVLMDNTLCQILSVLFAKDVALGQKNDEIAALQGRVAELTAQLTAAEADRLVREYAASGGINGGQTTVAEAGSIDHKRGQKLMDGAPSAVGR